MPFLYRYECKGIQKWILQSDKLKDIKGASALIDKVGERAYAEAKGCGATDEDIIVATAGVGLIRFQDAEKLKRFASEWPMLLDTLVPGVPVVHAWVEQEGSESQLGKLMDLAAAERNRPAVRFPQAAPMAVRAPRTGEAAVSRRDGEAVDAALGATRDEAADQESRDELCARFDVTGIDEDLHHWPDGYVAVVHIDGNAVGRTIMNLHVEPLRQFSEALAAATKAAAAAGTRAASDAWAGRGTSRGLPFRPLVLGGDDVTALMHASLAIPFTRAFLTTFEEKAAHLGQGANKGLTASAGIAFVNRKFPFAQAHDLAESLCKGAKEANQTTAKAQSRLLFHRVSTSVLRDWNSIRKEELADVLAGGPYTLNGTDARTLSHLLELVHLIGMTKVARSSLREWVTIVQGEGTGSRDRSNKRWERLLEVLDTTAPGRSKSLHDALTHLKANQKGRGADGSTPIYDALTLMGLGVRERA